jgi:phosphate transport system substrate-binding protein
LDQKYPISRPLFVYTLGEPQGDLKEFIDWILSPKGQAVVEEIGYVPVPKKNAEK